MSMKPTQIFPTGMNVYSDVFGATRRKGAYVVGRPDGPLSNIFVLSKEEAEELVLNLPPELEQLVVDKLLQGAEEAAVKIVEAVEETFEDDKFDPIAQDFTPLTVEEPVPNIEEVVAELEPDKYEAMNQKLLRQLCKERGIEGMGKATNDEMREELRLDDLEKAAE